MLDLNNPNRYTRVLFEQYAYSDKIRLEGLIISVEKARKTQDVVRECIRTQIRPIGMILHVKSTDSIIYDWYMGLETY